MRNTGNGDAAAALAMDARDDLWTDDISGGVSDRVPGRDI